MGTTLTSAQLAAVKAAETRWLDLHRAVMASPNPSTRLIAGEDDAYNDYNALMDELSICHVVGCLAITTTHVTCDAHTGGGA